MAYSKSFRKYKQAKVNLSKTTFPYFRYYKKTISNEKENKSLDLLHNYSINNYIT